MHVLAISRTVYTESIVDQNILILAISGVTNTCAFVAARHSNLNTNPNDNLILTSLFIQNRKKRPRVIVQSCDLQDSLY